MDWAESDSDQVTMNLQFASSQDAGDAIVVRDEDGNVVFAYDPSEDETASGKTRSYLGAVLSCPNFEIGQTYSVHVGGVVSGQETQGVYDVETVTGYEGGTQQAYTGTDIQGGPGGFGGPGGGMGPGGQGGPGGAGPDGQGGPGDGMGPGGEGGQGGPSGDAPANESGSPQGGDQEPPTMPSGDQSQDGQNGRPSGGAPDNGQGGEPPAGGNGEPPARPDDMQNGQPISDTAQANQSSSATPQTGQPSDDNNPQSGNVSEAQASTEFYMQDKVNAFSGVTAAA